MILRLVLILLFLAHFQPLFGQSDSLLLAEPQGARFFAAIVELRGDLHKEVNETLPAGTTTAIWQALVKPFTELSVSSSPAVLSFVARKHGDGKRADGKRGFRNPAEVLEWAVNPQGDSTALEIMPIYPIDPGLLGITSAIHLEPAPVGMCLRHRNSSPNIREWREFAVRFLEFASKLKAVKAKQNSRRKTDSAEKMVQKALELQGINCEVRLLKGVNALWIHTQKGSFSDLSEAIEFILKANEKA